MIGIGLGLGMTRGALSAGVSLGPADIIFVEGDVGPVGDLTFTTSANRLKRTGQCQWEKTAANEPRTYADNTGTVTGVIFDGADTIKGGDFFTAPGGSGDLQWGTITGGTGGTVSQVGGHSAPDIAGGTGKLVRFFGGTGANVECRFPNLTQSVVSGNVYRMEWLVSFDNPASPLALTMFPRAASGTGLSGNIPVQVATDGTVTITAGAARGIDLFDTSASGRKWYRIWAQYTSSGTGVYYPALSIPAGTVMVAMAQTLLNPTQAVPSVVPVMGNASFVADTAQLDPGVDVEVEWSDLAVGRTSIPDGIMVPPRMAHTRALALETRITVRKATEITALPYFLPNSRMGLNFVAGISDRLGPGWYDVSFQPSSGTSTLRSAYSAPARWAMLRQVRRLTGSTLTIDKVAVWLRAPIGNVTGSSLNATNVLELAGDPATVTVGDVLVSGAESRWSQFAVAPNRNNPPSYIYTHAGRVYVVPSATGTLTIGRLKAIQCNDALVVEVASARTLTLNTTGYATDKVGGDHFKLQGSGTQNHTHGHIACGEFEASPANFYQNQYEIEVDTGSGWQVLSASGLSVANLPLWPRFTQSGTHASGVVTDHPQPQNRLWVRDWNFFSSGSGSITRPGFEFTAPDAEFTDATTGEVIYRGNVLPANSVYTSDLVGTASPTNPRIRIRYAPGRWTSGPTFTATAGTLSTGAGAHGDLLQTVGSVTWSMASDNFVALGTGGQGFFAGQGTCTNLNVKGLFGVGAINGYGVAGTGSTQAISGLMTAPFEFTRNINGDRTVPTIGVLTGTTLNAGGLYISTFNNFPTGVGTISGTLSAGPIPAAANRMQGNTLVPAATDQPSATVFLSSFFTDASLREGLPLASIDTVALSALGVSTLPLVDAALNTVRAAGSAWTLFKPLEAVCTLGLPTHWATVVNSAAVGTALTLNAASATSSLTGTRIVKGDPRGLFRIVSGVLQVNSALVTAYGVALVDNYALETDAGERVSVQVTA